MADILAAARAKNTGANVADLSRLGLDPTLDNIPFDKGFAAFEKYGFDTIKRILAQGLDSSPEPIPVADFAALHAMTSKMSCQTHNLSPPLYENSVRLVNDYQTAVVIPALQALPAGRPFLEGFRTRWQNHIWMSHWMKLFNRHLDTSYVANKSVPQVGSACLRAFHTHTFTQFEARVTQALLDEITLARGGDGGGDLTLVADVVSCFTHMGCAQYANDVDKIVGPNEFSRGTWKRAPTLLEHRNLKTYNRFQSQLIAHSKEYYRVKAAGWVAQDTTAVYLAKAKAALEFERALVQDRLNAETMTPLVREVEDMILRGPDRAYLAFILESDTGVGYMLNNDKIADLHNMHSVLERIGEQQPMADAVRDHIVRLGSAIVKKRVQEIAARHAAKKQDEFKVSSDFIHSLIDLYRKYDTVIREKFSRDVLFENALSQAFTSIAKDEPGDADEIDPAKGEVLCNAEMLAAHLNSKYEKSSDFEGDGLETHLSECARLFEFLLDKDLFLENYKQYLSRRLLDGDKKKSIEDEKLFISNIKIKEGAAFTKSLETMVSDVEKCLANDGAESKSGGGGGGGGGEGGGFNSARWQRDWIKIQEADPQPGWLPGGVFNVRPLTMRCWPSAPNPPHLLLPQCVKDSIEHYQRFFKSFAEHSDRGLNWAHMLGQVELTFLPKRMKHRVEMTPLQAYVCLSFTSFDHVLSGAELHAMLNFEEQMGVAVGKASRLKRVLHALCAYKPKYSVLKMLKNGKKTKKFDVKVCSFTPNWEFKNDKRKFKLLRPQFDKRKAKEKVLEDRKDNIDAVIMRVMKTSSRMNAKKLLNTVMEKITQFSTTKKDIKPRFQTLMDRGFLMRDEDDPNVLCYLA